MYTLDGLSNMDVNFNLYILPPSIDAIKEFKVQSGIYPAEFGRELGQVNVSTISGGNQYHGVLFEFLRNNKTDAVTYQFTPVAPVNPPFKWNQYGFTLDGPLSIPKVFNAKNKLFFMTNFEGFQPARAHRTALHRPTPAMRAGDLSPGLTVRERVRPCLLPLGPYAERQRHHHGHAYPRQHHSPQPDHAGLHHHDADDVPAVSEPAVRGDNPVNNYLGCPSTPVDKYQFTSRMDFNENAKSSWFARFSWTGEDQHRPRPWRNAGQAIHTHAEQYLRFQHAHDFGHQGERGALRHQRVPQQLRSH